MSKPRIKIAVGKKQPMNRFICYGTPAHGVGPVVAFGATMRHAYQCWAAKAYPATPIRRRTKSG